jgi:hypothetical protein
MPDPTPCVFRGGELAGFVERFMGGTAYLTVWLPDGREVECEVPEAAARAHGLRERRRFRCWVRVEDVPDLPDRGEVP